jgi:hypothetical protein
MSMLTMTTTTIPAANLIRCPTTILGKIRNFDRECFPDRCPLVKTLRCFSYKRICSP